MLTTFDSIAVVQLIHSIIPVNVLLIQEGKATFHNTKYSVPERLQTPLTFFNTFENGNISQTNTSEYFHYTDQNALEYILTVINHKNNLRDFIMVGPFLSNHFSENSIEQLLLRLHPSISEGEIIRHFCHNLPTLKEEEIESLGNLLVNICQNPLIMAKKINLFPKEKPKETLPKDTPSNNLLLASNTQRQLIEQRYHEQNRMLDIISIGNIEQLNHHLSGFSNAFIIFKDRISGNPLRSIKNIAISLNTMCRMAAERGHVHPFYLDRLSERYAIDIEKYNTLDSLKELFTDIPIAYCKLVAKHTTKHYSPIIRQAVDYIQIHLGYPIRLNDIAGSIPISPSYLSRKFNKEVGMSITKYINQHRISESKTLLNNTQLTVTEIAYFVGFNDLNYFIKIFKKETGTSPNSYRNHNKYNSNTID